MNEIHVFEISECFSHPAALVSSDKKRSMANLAEFTLNYKVARKHQTD